MKRLFAFMFVMLCGVGALNVAYGAATREQCESGTAVASGAYWSSLYNDCQCNNSSDGRAMRWDSVTKRCVVVNSSANNCIARRTTAEGKACCYLAADIAKWNSETDECECLLSDENGNRWEFYMTENNRRGLCAPRVAGAWECPLDYPWAVYKVSQTCNSGAVTDSARAVSEFCTNETINQTYEMYKNLYDNLQSEVLACVGDKVENLETVVRDGSVDAKVIAELKISQSATNLRRILGGLDTTVWRTADGKFNTVRLASDSIAAVVLGTAGGLITSNVIKKNQVENGFEDIQCTIGGQAVAGWGDQFHVGIQ